MELEPLARMSRDIANAAQIMSKEEARFLVDRYYQSQEDRIRSNNQLRAATGSNREEPHETLAWLAGADTVLEAQIKRALQKYMSTHIMGDWLDDVVGVGPVIGAGLVSRINIERADHASALWRYCGLAPGQKRRAGERLDFNPALKRLCWIMGDCFVKFHNHPRGVYGRIYRSRKAQEQAHNDNGKYAQQAHEQLRSKRFSNAEARAILESGKLPPGHIEQRARRYAVKMFLCDFWVEWRKREGLPSREPFAVEHLGHPMGRLD